MKLDNLRAFVSLFKDTLLALAGISQHPEGWILFNTDGRRRADAGAVDAMRVKWMHTNPDIIADELAENILSTTDRARLVDAYKSRLVGVGVIDDITGYVAGVDKYGDCENEADFVVKVEALCNEVNFVSKRVVEAIKKELGGVSEPQRPAQGREPQRHKSNQQRKDERDRAAIAGAADMWKKAIKLGLVEENGGGYRWKGTAALYGYFVEKVTEDYSNGGRTPWRLLKGIITNHADLVESAKDARKKRKQEIVTEPINTDLVDKL